MNDYIERKHFAEHAAFIYKILGGEEQLKYTDMIGPVPDLDAITSADPPPAKKTDQKIISDWKAKAKARGLKSGGE